MLPSRALTLWVPKDCLHLCQHGHEWNADDQWSKVIDVNFYPTEKTRRSNLLHRPIGIGVQGLADVFMLMDIPFYSEEAKVINKNIFETIYHAALEKSNELAQERHHDMLFLASHYESWRPQTSRSINNLVSRDYELVYPPCKTKNKIQRLLRICSPIPAEIEVEL